MEASNGNENSHILCMIVCFLFKASVDYSLKFNLLCSRLKAKYCLCIGAATNDHLIYLIYLKPSVFKMTALSD